MQDRYAGDVGDFGKFILLNAVVDQGLRLGVNWYLTPTTDVERDQDDGKFRIPEKLADLSPELADKLCRVFDGKGYTRSVESLENAGVLPVGTIYYRDKFSERTSRAIWHEDALKRLSKCDVVFLDPDNGIRPKSVGPRSAKSCKYVFENEIIDYYSRGQSVIFYNHRKRVGQETYFQEFTDLFRRIVPEVRWFAVTSRKGTVRDYFILPQPEQEEKIMKALCSINSDFLNIHQRSDII